MKLAWRLAVAGAVFKVAIGPIMGLLFKAGLRVMLAGGPIKAVKAAFFGGFANVRACVGRAESYSRRPLCRHTLPLTSGMHAPQVFGTISSVLAGRGPLDAVARFFGKLARG